ncbi:MAG TPA: AAA family ATPase [Candidatus Binatus sp.]|nr:AAA family ATPase [Candidatus Binatus sp.]
MNKTPFENFPDPVFYFPSTLQEEGLRQLLSGLQARERGLMITGEIGCGKTLISRVLVRELAKDRYDTVLLTQPSFNDVADFVEEILCQLGINPAGNPSDNVHLLHARLLENLGKGKATVLIVDDAQAINNAAIGAFLQQLLTSRHEGHFLLTLVVLGEPELKVKVESFMKLSQLIGIRYHLMPFNREEVGKYINHRMKVAGASRCIFTPEALQAVYAASSGIPRRVNTLCDKALMVGFLAIRQQVDPGVVKRARELMLKTWDKP